MSLKDIQEGTHVNSSGETLSVGGGVLVMVLCDPKRLPSHTDVRTLKAKHPCFGVAIGIYTPKV